MNKPSFKFDRSQKNMIRAGSPEMDDEAMDKNGRNKIISISVKSPKMS